MSRHVEGMRERKTPLLCAVASKWRTMKDKKIKIGTIFNPIVSSVMGVNSETDCRDI